MYPSPHEQFTDLLVTRILRAQNVYATFPSNYVAAVAHDFDRRPDFHASSEGRHCCWQSPSDGGMMMWWMWMNGLELGESCPGKERSAGREQRSEHDCVGEVREVRDKSPKLAWLTDTEALSRLATLCALYTTLITYVHVDLNVAISPPLEHAPPFREATCFAATGWKVCSHSLRPISHCVCCRESTHPSLRPIPFYQFCLSSHHLYSMCKAPFTFGSRSSSCGSLTSMPALRPLSHQFNFSQLHSSLLIYPHLPTATTISRPHYVCIFRISPSRPISRYQDSVRSLRPEPPRYPSVALPIYPLSSFDGLPDAWPHSSLLTLVFKRVVGTVSVDRFPGDIRVHVPCHDRISDITAIWNTNAFFAYIITVRLFKLDWEFRKLLAVLIATFGVLAVVYGDAKQSASPLSDHRKALASDATESGKPKAPLLGDLLSLCASFGYGLYQVLYKRHAALPLDQEFELGSSYVPLPESDGIPASELGEAGTEIDDLTYPPPFGLHANLIASGLGLMTFLFLWIMLPFLHYSGYERFRLPDNPTITLSIAGIAASGLVFNVGMLVTTFLCLSVLGLTDDFFCALRLCWVFGVPWLSL